MVRCDLIHSRPAFSRIDFDLGELRHALYRSSQDLFDESVVEICSEAVGLFGVGPRQKEARTFAPKMKAGRHIDHHRKLRRKLIEGFGLDDLSPQWLNWYVRARELRYAGGPGTCRVYDSARCDVSPIGLKTFNTS